MADDEYPLHLAAQFGKVSEVCCLLQAGVNINELDDEGYTALQRAIQSGHTTIVELLLADGADTRILGISGCPMHLATGYGYVQIIELLLEHQARAYIESEYGDLPIHFAAEKGHVDVINCFLQNGVPVDVRSDREYTPLHIAARCGKQEAVEFLLSKKANVNSIGCRNYSPLHVAAKNGHAEVVKLLIEKGARINEKTLEGWTSLYFAAEYGHKKVLQLLFEAGAICKLTGIAKWNSPLFRAADGDHTEVIEYFLEKGANVDFQTANGLTLLHVATRRGHTPIVRLLIEKGAYINARYRSKGYTPLYFGILYCWPDIIDLLIQNGANLEETDNRGSDVLYLVFKEYLDYSPEYIQQNHKKSAEILIKYIVLRNENIEPLLPDVPFQNELFKFWHDCKQELEKMKSCIIGNTTISLYTILQNIFDDTRFATYLYNEDIMQELKNPQNYLKHFPLYGNITISIEICIRKGIERQHLLEEADLIMVKMIPKLPVESRWEIFSYLNTNDLSSFITSIQNS